MGLNDKENPGFARVCFFIIEFMGKMIGYLITWTTYGTWLQGDKRGYVKHGEVSGENKRLRESNICSQRGKVVRLTLQQQEVVRKAILREAKNLGQKIYAIAVCTNHIHVVVDCIDEAIETVVARYKKAARQALNVNGFLGRVWTRGYDKRYCFDEKSLKDRIGYVHRHN